MGLIFYLVTAVMSGILCLIFYQMYRPTGGKVFHITLPVSAQEDDAVQDIVSRYKRRMLGWLAFLLALPLPVFFLERYFSMQFMLMGAGILFFIVLLTRFPPQRKATREVYALALSRGWELGPEDHFWRDGIYRNPLGDAIISDERANLPNWGSGSGRLLMVIIIGVIVLVFGVLGVLFVHEDVNTPQMALNEGHIAITGTFFGFSIPAGTVTDIRLTETLPDMRRDNGFSTSRLHRGAYSLYSEERTRVRCAVYADCPPFIEITYGDGLVYFNLPGAALTIERFEQLCGELGLK